MRVKMINDYGQIKEVKVGFSWTVFFFGFFVPLVRGHWSWALIMFVLQSIVSVITYGMGGFLVGIILSIMYNKIYIQHLMDNRYRPASQIDADILRSKGIYTA